MMQEEIVDIRIIQDLATEFLHVMTLAKRRLERENTLFDKRGAGAFGKSQKQVLALLQDFHDVYQKFCAVEDWSEKIGVERIDAIQRERLLFLDVLEEFSINLRVAKTINEFFISATKEALESKSKTNNGYNKDGLWMSDKEIIANTPPLTFNNKV